MVNGVEIAVMMEGLESSKKRSLEGDDMETMSWALYGSGLQITGDEYSKVLFLGPTYC